MNSKKLKNYGEENRNFYHNFNSEYRFLQSILQKRYSILPKEVRNCLDNLNVQYSLLEDKITELGEEIERLKKTNKN